MPASLFCASRPRMSATELVCPVCAAPSVTPSQLRRSSTTTYTQLVVFVASLLEVLPAAPRGGTRRHLEGGRELRAASAPSQQHQLRRSSSSRRRLCPATIGQPLESAAPRIMFRRPRTDRLSSFILRGQGGGLGLWATTIEI